MNQKYYSPEQIAEKTRLYFEGINNIEDKNTPTDLTEAAQANVKKFELGVMIPFHDNKLNPTFANAIETGKTIFHNEHPDKTTTSNDLTRTAEIKNIASGPSLALVKKEESPLSLPRAGYINIAILLYGVLNIGIIVAIALMK